MLFFSPFARLTIAALLVGWGCQPESGSKGGAGGSGAGAGAMAGSSGAGQPGSGGNAGQGTGGGTGNIGGGAGAGGTGGAGAPDTPARDASSSQGEAEAGSGDVAAGEAARDGGADTAAPAALGPVGGGCSPGQSYETARPITPNAVLIKGGFAFTEGPTWVPAERALFFTEFTGVGTSGRIHRYHPASGAFSVLVDGVGVNGMALTSDGALLGAAHFQQRLLRFDPSTGDRAEVPGGDRYMDRPFNSINDVIVRSDGNIYFTDPTYQRGNRPGQDATGIYRLSPQGMISRLGTSAQPNGVALSPDGLLLYVSSVGGAPVRRYRLTPEGGSTGPPTTFVERESEGVAIDCAGNVYLTTEGRVRVFSAAGNPLFEVGGFPDRLTNLGFGGPEHKTLFITARPGSLYRVEMNLPGYPN